MTVFLLVNIMACVKIHLIPTPYTNILIKILFMFQSPL